MQKASHLHLAHTYKTWHSVFTGEHSSSTVYHRKTEHVRKKTLLILYISNNLESKNKQVLAIRAKCAVTLNFKTQAEHQSLVHLHFGDFSSNPDREPRCQADVQCEW